MSTYDNREKDDILDTLRMWRETHKGTLTAFLIMFLDIVAYFVKDTLEDIE